MRFRQFVVFVNALSSMTVSSAASHRGGALAQTGSERFSDGLTPGDHLRIGVGSVSPVNPQGSLRDWNRGQGISLIWENWDAGSTGVGRVGYGLGVDYALLPLDQQQFLLDFVNTPNGTAQSATGKKAGVLIVGVTTRFRIPAPYIMPSISLGFGFLDWRPGEVSYTATGGSGTAKQQHRSGGAITIGGGLDKHVYDRFAIFGEALYTYAYTSFGQGLAGSGSSCLTTNCDLLKNTQFGTIRGGLRVRFGR